MNIERILSDLLWLAEAAIAEGVQHARADDPHRFARLPREFDDGRAMRRLQFDFLGSGRVEVSCQLIGTSAGEPKAVGVFCTRLESVPASGTH